ncbi:hypothetical protein [Cupriavidus sp. DL-D2]|uniref:hypothetical protein n=1 Tax=Cupriavidus sp. DL-D2 TaxID=3144974 RepID=UPI003214214E
MSLRTRSVAPDRNRIGQLAQQGKCHRGTVQRVLPPSQSPCRLKIAVREFGSITRWWDNAGGIGADMELPNVVFSR